MMSLGDVGGWGVGVMTECRRGGLTLLGVLLAAVGRTALTAGYLTAGQIAGLHGQLDYRVLFPHCTVRVAKRVLGDRYVAASAWMQIQCECSVCL